MRVAVVGAGGQVGSELMRQLAAASIDAVGIARQSQDELARADLLDRGSIERALAAAAPSHVILCAAATNVAWCEANPAASAAINVDGTAAVADVARSLGAHLTFISTDYVFDGADGPYAESAATNPINEYGRQKLAAEAAVLADPEALVVRTCQVFGPDPKRANFILRVADRLTAGETVEVEDDLFGTPTYVTDLGRSLLALIGSGAAGVWHVSGDRWLSRLELAQLVARTARQTHDSVVPIQARGDVPRPKRSGLISERVHEPALRSTKLVDAIAKVLAG